MFDRPYIPFVLALAAFSPLFLLFLHVIPDGLERSELIVDYFVLVVFLLALALAVLEEFTDLRKSKPMVLAAGIVWGAIAWLAAETGTSHEAERALRENLLQYAELMLFLLAAMTYINAMSERRLFLYLRDWLGHQRVSCRRLFWLVGFATFFLSPILDNLTTALLMGAVVVAIGVGNPRFVALSCISVVVAANAGGVFSPFGDITTLMVWQQNIQTSSGPVDFVSFFQLFVPALVSFLIPAYVLHLALPEACLSPAEEPTRPLRGAWTIAFLFLVTIAMAVVFQSLLNLPAVIGMLTGLSFLKFFGFYLKKTHRSFESGSGDEEEMGGPVPLDGENPFDIFDRVSRVEWDTLLFLYGVALCVGGLGYLGHLALVADFLYSELGVTLANVGAGMFSAILENIPAMFMVLNMAPEMSREQWLLVTFATGTGGSLLAIGSAAGIALMGLARDSYTFLEHLKWAPVIGIGFAAGVAVHLYLSGIGF